MAYRPKLDGAQPTPHLPWVFIACSAITATALTGGAAHADEGAKGPRNKARCGEALRKSEEDEQQGRLRQARDELLGCAKSSCGASLEQQCAARFSRLDSVDVPTILPIITDASGAASPDVQIAMDGEVLATRIDNQPIAVDPGVHEFTFTFAGGASVTKKLLIVQGQRNRPIAISLGGPSPSEQAAAGAASAPGAHRGSAGSHVSGDDEESSATHGPSPWPYVLGVVGGALVAGAAAGAVLFSGWGQKDGFSLGDNLTIGLAVGAGATTVGVATWLFATSHSREHPPPASALRFGVAPTQGGAVGTIWKTF